MDDVKRAKAKATAAPVGIPLELAPLVSPYARYRNLSLRLERVPDRAQLSKGRNNGDRTWSLTPDDLAGLLYLPPAGAVAAHTLTMRIISVDNDFGATLAVLDVPVALGDAPPEPPRGAAAPGDDAELRRLRDELAEAKASLGARDKALAEAAAAAEQSRAAWQAEQASKADAAARHTAAEAQWREQSGRAVAEATARFERAEAALARAPAEAERDQSDNADLRRLRDEHAAMQAALAAREAGLAEAAAAAEQSRAAWQAEQRDRVAVLEARARERIEQAQERAQREAEMSLAKAKETWSADAAARIAAAEAQWRAQSGQALAEATTRFERAETALARARADAERARGDDAELRRLRDDLAATLAARETELAEAAAAAEQSRAAWQAEQRDRVAVLEARARERIEQAQERAQQEAEMSLAKAKETWNADAAARIAAAEAQWRTQSGQALAQATARFERAETALAARDAELAQARSAAEQARERRQRETEASLAKAAEAWKADAAAAEAQWREQSGRVLAEATARFERAEAALAAARARAEAVGDRGDDTALGRLREEHAAMQAALAARDTELAQARERWTAQARAAIRKAEEAWKAEEAQRLAAARQQWQKEARIAQSKNIVAKGLAQDRRAQIAFRLVRFGALAASLALAVVFYPRIEPIIRDGVWPKIGMLASGLEPYLRKAEAPTGSPVPAPPQVAEQRTVIGVPVANVRAGPSTATAVITTLPRDREVTPVERRGSWVLIRIAGDDGKQQQQGWVYGSFLTDAAGR